MTANEIAQIAPPAGLRNEPYTEKRTINKTYHTE